MSVEELSKLSDSRNADEVRAPWANLATYLPGLHSFVLCNFEKLDSGIELRANLVSKC